MNTKRKWPSRVSASLLTVFIFLTVPSLGIWLGVLKGGQVDALVKNTLNNGIIRQDISQELAKTILSNMDKKKALQAEAKKSELVNAISLQLSQSATQAKLSFIANQFFDAVTTGKMSITLDPTPIADDFVIAVNSVSGIEKIKRKNLKDLKPITVGSSSKPLPNLSPIVTIVTTVAFVTLALSIMCALLLIKFSQTLWRSLSVPLLLAGGFWSGIHFVAFHIIPGKLENGIQADVIPIIAKNLLSGVYLLAIVLLIIGAFFLVTHYVVRHRSKNLISTNLG